MADSQITARPTMSNDNGNGHDVGIELTSSPSSMIRTSLSLDGITNPSMTHTLSNGGGSGSNGVGVGVNDTTELFPCHPSSSLVPPLPSSSPSSPSASLPSPVDGAITATNVTSLLSPPSLAPPTTVVSSSSSSNVAPLLPSASSSLPPAASSYPYPLIRVGTRRSDKRDVKQLALLKEYQNIDRLLRWTNLRLTLTAGVGVALLMIQNQVCFDPGQSLLHDDWKEGDCYAGQVLKACSLASSFVAVGFLVRYYYIKTQRVSLEWKLSMRDSFCQTSLKWRFLLETFVLLCQPVPFLNSIWGLGPKNLVVMLFIRLYLVLRLIRDFSRVHIHRRTLADGTDFAKPEFVVDDLTVFKAHFATRPAILLALTFGMSAVSLSYVMYLLEREFWESNGVEANLPTLTSQQHPDPALYMVAPLASFPTCCWFVGVTMLTIGYGDVTPNSWQGRMFAIISALVGLVLTSLTITAFTQALVASPFEQFVVEWLQRGEVTMRKRQLAAQLIQLAWRDYRTRQRYKLQQKALADTFAENKVAISHARRASLTAHISASIIDRMGAGHLRQSHALNKFLSPSHNQRVRLIKQLRRTKRQEHERGNGMMSPVSTTSSLVLPPLSSPLPLPSLTPTLATSATTGMDTTRPAHQHHHHHRRTSSNGSPARSVKRNTTVAAPPPFPPYPYAAAAISPPSCISRMIANDGDDGDAHDNERTTSPPGGRRLSSQSINSNIGMSASLDDIKRRADGNGDNSDDEAAERRAAHRAAYRASLGMSPVSNTINTSGHGHGHGGGTGGGVGGGGNGNNVRASLQSLLLSSSPGHSLGIRERLTSIEEAQASQSQQLTELVSAVRLMYQQMGVMYMSMHNLSQSHHHNNGNGNGGTDGAATATGDDNHDDEPSVTHHQPSMARRPSTSGMVMSTAPRVSVRVGKAFASVPRTATQSMNNSTTGGVPMYSAATELAAMEAHERKVTDDANAAGGHHTRNHSYDHTVVASAASPLSPLPSMGMPGLPPLRTNNDVSSGNNDDSDDTPVPLLTGRRRATNLSTTATAAAQSRQQAAAVMAHARALINSSMASVAIAGASQPSPPPQPFTSSSFPELGLPPFAAASSSSAMASLGNARRVHQSSIGTDSDDDRPSHVSFTLPPSHSHNHIDDNDAPHFHVEP